MFYFYFYFSRQFNDFNSLGSNVNNNFNCYSNENDGNVGIDFQFMFSSFVDRKLTTYFLLFDYCRYFHNLYFVFKCDLN